MSEHSTVLVLDYGALRALITRNSLPSLVLAATLMRRPHAGSQYTQLIARRIREIGAFSLLVPGDVTLVRSSTCDPETGGPYRPLSLSLTNP